MKKYLKDLEVELRKNNLSEEEIQDILADHQEMIETAINEGLNDSELEAKFGNPKEVAEELSQFTEKEEGREKKIMKTKEFTGVEENYNVHVGLISEDVEFVHGEENKILVEYEGSRGLEKYDISFEKNEFVLKRLSGFGFNTILNVSKEKFTITLPAGLKINHFKLKEINGDVKLSEIVSDSFAIETNNGDLKMSSVKTKEFKISSINGDMSLEDAEAESFRISQISGDLKLKQFKIQKEFDAHTVSGDIRVEDVSCKEFALKTVSGDLDGTEFYPESMSLSSVSGDIKITNTDASRTIEITRKKTVSGDIEIKIKK